MHEMGVAEEIARIAISSIPGDIPDPRVGKVSLRVGRLAAVVKESLTFCFEIIAKGTPLEGARLEIEDVPVMVVCKGCFHEWEVTGPIFECPNCKKGEVEILTGRELEISSIELVDVQVEKN